jgi:hypothetical protein
MPYVRFTHVFALFALMPFAAFADDGDAVPAMADVDVQTLLASGQALVTALLTRASFADVIVSLACVIWLIRWPLARLTPTRRDDDALARADAALAAAGLQPVPLLQRLLRWLRMGRGAL